MNDDKDSINLEGETVEKVQNIDIGAEPDSGASADANVDEESNPIEIEEPSFEKNSIKSLVGSTLKKVSFANKSELTQETEEVDQKNLDSGSIDENEEDSVEDIAEINIEIDEDLANENELEEEIVLNTFDRRKNRYKKGTLKWLREEHQIVSENVEFLEKEFDKLKNVLKVGIATYKSARETSEEKEKNLVILTAQIIHR